MTKYSAFGVALKRGAVEIAQVLTISGPNISIDTADVTEHDGEGWEEVVVTILRSGEVSFEIAYDPGEATHKNASGGLLYDLVNRQSQTWTITLPSSPTADISFTGYVISFEPSMPVEDKLSASVTIKPTGVVTLP